MSEHEYATFGGGCFWCIEAAFQEGPGVISVVSGYAGGDTAEPSYREVCTGNTGHAEVVQIEFDPRVVSYAELLELFVLVHDPTQTDRQGPDVGSQYRSIILAHSDEQRRTAESFIETIADDYTDPIATEVEPLEQFWEAEPYHQDYFARNPDDAYCRYHAAPKVERVRAEYGRAADRPS